MEALAVSDPRQVGVVPAAGPAGRRRDGAGVPGLLAGGRAVAVKVIHRELAGDAEFRTRFRREVAAASVVNGAYTAPVIAAGPDDDPPWLATVFVPGPSLAEAVHTAGPLPPASVWRLAGGLVEALQAVHACGLVHRDLKPANVLLALDGPRVIDFGISRALEKTAMTSTGMIVGTPSYMSPEQAEGSRVGRAQRRVLPRLRDRVRRDRDRPVRPRPAGIAAVPGGALGSGDHGGPRRAARARGGLPGQAARGPSHAG